ncbi:hypothetical protein FB451DRAFT_1163681 [Mycena latifolia]|nr:hypothetical protein FB451DRAFT_1163681 [Mycena latifolia]
MCDTFSQMRQITILGMCLVSEIDGAQTRQPSRDHGTSRHGGECRPASKSTRTQNGQHAAMRSRTATYVIPECNQVTVRQAVKEFDIGSQALGGISCASLRVDDGPFVASDDSDDDNQSAAKPFHIKSEMQESDTIWQDPGITSLVINGKFRITAKLTVERIEYVMPSMWPNPRIPTAFVLNLGSSYDAIDPKTGMRYTMDQLIKNRDNDSWKSDGSGKADGEPKVIFDPWQPAIPCRRARMSCKGVHACERIDRAPPVGL